MKFRTKLRIFFGGGKKKYVRVRINRPDRAVDVFYVHRKHIKEGLITIPEEKKAFAFFKKNVVFGEGGFREVIYNHNVHNPIEYLPEKDSPSGMPPETVYAIMEEKVSRNIIQHSSVDYDKLKMLATLTLGAVGLVGVILYFVMSSALGEMQSEITELQEQIKDMADALSRLRP